MAKADSPSNVANSETEITLGLLNAVHEDSAVTQRSVASDLGIALGLANAYLKRCVRKGLIKVKQIPPNRYAYYLTPQGFAEKSRLTKEYLSYSFTFFRNARAQCTEIFRECGRQEWTPVALWGVGDLAEIATLSGREHDVPIAGIVDATRRRGEFAGLPVVPHFGELGRIGAVVLTDLDDPQGSYDRLVSIMPVERIFAPPILRVTQVPTTDTEPAENTP